MDIYWADRPVRDRRPRRTVPVLLHQRRAQALQIRFVVVEMRRDAQIAVSRRHHDPLLRQRLRQGRGVPVRPVRGHDVACFRASIDAPDRRGYPQRAWPGPSRAARCVSSPSSRIICDGFAHAVERREIQHAAFVLLGGLGAFGRAVVQFVDGAPARVAAPSDHRGRSACAQFAATHRRTSRRWDTAATCSRPPRACRGWTAADIERKRADALRAVHVEQRAARGQACESASRSGAVAARCNSRC